MSDFKNEYINGIKLDICAAPEVNSNDNDDIIAQLQRLIFMKVSFTLTNTIAKDSVHQIDYINIVKFKGIHSRTHPLTQAYTLTYILQ